MDVFGKTVKKILTGRAYGEIRITVDVDQQVRNFSHYRDELCGGIRKRYPDINIKVRIVPR